MTKPLPPAVVNRQLERALREELKEIRRKENGKFVYDILERMRVYDRALKLESIKMKADDAQFGTAFNEGENDDR